MEFTKILKLNFKFGTDLQLFFLLIKKLSHTCSHIYTRALAVRTCKQTTYVASLQN